MITLLAHVILLGSVIVTTCLLVVEWKRNRLNKEYQNKVMKEYYDGYWSE